MKLLSTNRCIGCVLALFLGLATATAAQEESLQSAPASRGSDSKEQLSPPWYTLQRQLTYSIGAFGGVSVSPLQMVGQNYSITIQAMNRTMAQGLVNILTLSYDFGPKVIIFVKDETGAVMTPATGPQTQAKIKEWLEAGLTGNPFFYGTKTFGVPFHGQALYLVLAPQVIQFYSDNFIDPQGVLHYVAQDVFASVLRNNFPGAGTLYFTTAAPVNGY